MPGMGRGAAGKWAPVGQLCVLVYLAALHEPHAVPSMETRAVSSNLLAAACCGVQVC